MYVDKGITIKDLLSLKALHDSVDVADLRQNNVWVLTTPNSYDT